MIYPRYEITRMSPSGRISVDSLLSSRVSGDYSDTNLAYWSTADRKKPSRDVVEKFKDSHWSLKTSSSSVSGLSDAKSRYDLNWCNVDDYIGYWNKFSDNERESLKSLLYSDTSSNLYRFGLKTRNLEAHLLLSIGCDMNNILNSKKDYVLSNLKINGKYSKDCVDSRTLDPKTCMRAYKKFSKQYDIEEMFRKGFKSYHGVISLDPKYSKVSDPRASKELFQEFFKSNSKALSNLSLKKKKIGGYLYSHEISVDSIENQLYRAHTHIIIFLPKDKKGDPLRHLQLEELEETFNSQHTDRKLEMLRTEEEEFKSNNTYKGLENMIQYLFRSYSLADQYLREITETNIRALNIKTVETYHNLAYFFKSEENHSLKGVRRFGSSQIPKKDKSDTRLQKEEKSNTIKKEISTSPPNARTIPYFSNVKPQSERGATQECNGRNAADLGGHESLSRERGSQSGFHSRNAQRSRRVQPGRALQHSPRQNKNHSSPPARLSKKESRVVGAPSSRRQELHRSSPSWNPPRRQTQNLLRSS